MNNVNDVTIVTVQGVDNEETVQIHGITYDPFNSVLIVQATLRVYSRAKSRYTKVKPFEAVYGRTTGFDSIQSRIISEYNKRGGSVEYADAIMITVCEDITERMWEFR